MLGKTENNAKITTYTFLLTNCKQPILTQANYNEIR